MQDDRTIIRDFATQTETWMPLSEMRWRGGKLQQQWLVETRPRAGLGPAAISMRHVWRDVPEVPADAE